MSPFSEPDRMFRSWPSESPALFDFSMNDILHDRWYNRGTTGALGKHNMHWICSYETSGQQKAYIYIYIIYIKGMFS